MLATLIKKEIQQDFYSLRFLVISLLAVVLVMTSVYVMHQDYTGRLEEYNHLVAEAYVTRASTPPAPLAVLAKGLDRNLSQIYTILFGGYIIAQGNQESQNELFRIFVTPDPLYVVKVILAFCALLFSFSSITVEKESGTLSLALSNGIRRADFLVGKWIGGFSCFILPFLVSFLLALCLLSLSPSIELDSASWFRALLFFFSAIIYLAVFFSLGLLISCLTRRSATSLALSLMIWLLFVFVVPNTSGILAEQLEPSPSLQRLQVHAAQVVQSSLVGTFEESRKNNPDPKKEAMKVDMRDEKLAVEYTNSLDRQAATTRVLAGWSPAAAFTFLATDLAGTGLVEEKRFKQAVLQYSGLLLSLPWLPGGQGLKDPPPVFTYSRTSLGEIMAAGGLISIAVLLLESVLAFAAAVLAFLRYDLR